MWNFIIFSGQLRDYGDDPLQSEPKKNTGNAVRKYPCDECEYVAGIASNLRKHIKNIHEGVRYPCDKCDHVSS